MCSLCCSAGETSREFEGWTCSYSRTWTICCCKSNTGCCMYFFSFSFLTFLIFEVLSSRDRRHSEVGRHGKWPAPAIHAYLWTVAETEIFHCEDTHNRTVNICWSTVGNKNKFGKIPVVSFRRIFAHLKVIIPVLCKQNHFSITLIMYFGVVWQWKTAKWSFNKRSSSTWKWAETNGQ